MPKPKLTPSSSVGVAAHKIEFGIRWEDVIVQNDLLPAKLVEAAGRFGLSIVIAHYPVEEY